jgi:hypothetical protein
MNRQETPTTTFTGGEVAYLRSSRLGRLATSISRSSWTPSRAGGPRSWATPATHRGRSQRRDRPRRNGCLHPLP